VQRRCRDESPADQRVQQIVHGVFGVKLPPGCPPFAAHVPPVGVATVKRAFVVAMQPDGKETAAVGAPQPMPLEVVAVAPAQLSPTGGSHVQGEHMRVSSAVA
jgi:hypothetical protein